MSIIGDMRFAASRLCNCGNCVKSKARADLERAADAVAASHEAARSLASTARMHIDSASGELVVAVKADAWEAFCKAMANCGVAP